MASKKDFYSVLGVSESAKADEIKKAYRKLARQYHPDRNPDDAKAEERFKEIQEAHETLSDPKKRKEYDIRRRNPFGFGDGFQTDTGGRFYQRPDGTYVRFDRSGGRAGGAGEDAPGFGSLFERFFGGDASAQRNLRGSDIQSSVNLTFDQSLQGGKTNVRLPNGTSVRITIPKGVRSGFKIRIRGRGEQGPGGKGDLYVTFSVAKHPKFRRKEDDLYTTVAINVFEALLGTQRNIETAYGKQIKLNIPAGTQPGEKLRLRRQGVETDETTGDLYVEVEVAVPKDLTTEQKARIAEAAGESGFL